MTSLAQYSVARAALAEAVRLDQVIHVRDEVEHLKLYAKQIKDRSLMADAIALQLECERRLGQVLIAAKEAGQIAEGRRPRNCTAEVQFPRVVLDEVGIDRKLSAKAQKAASLSERAFAAMVEQARNKIAGIGAKVVKAKEQKPAPPEQPSDFPRDHRDPSTTWRGGFDRIWRSPPNPSDRAWALRVIADSLTIKERRRMLLGDPITEKVDGETGEVLDDLAEREGDATQSSPLVVSSQPVESGLPRIWLARAANLALASANELHRETSTIKPLESGLPQPDVAPVVSVAPIPAAGPDFVPAEHVGWPEMPPFLDRRSKAS